MNNTCNHCDNIVTVEQWVCTECENSMLFDNIISQAFKISVFSYNSEVSDDFFNVMDCVEDGCSNSAIAEKLGLSPNYVELIQYLLCNNGHAEYGTSPRGCWLTDKGIEVYEKLKTLRKYE